MSSVKNRELGWRLATVGADRIVQLFDEWGSPSSPVCGVFHHSPQTIPCRPVPLNTLLLRVLSPFLWES